MSDFDFLNEHSNLKVEINDALRIVYANAVNAEKYYEINSEKCMSFIREAATEICRIYSMCYSINSNGQWLNDYVNQTNNIARYIGTGAYGRLLYIQQNSRFEYCNNAELVKNVMWTFYCACADLHRILGGQSVISNTPRFMYVLPATGNNVSYGKTSVKDSLFASLNKATNDLARVRGGKTVTSENSDEVMTVIYDLLNIVKQSNEKLNNQEKLINNITRQLEMFNKQSSLQQQEYDRSYSKIDEILNLIKQSGSNASVDDVWSKVNTIDDRIQSIELIQKQKLDTVSKFTGNVYKTIDGFVDTSKVYLRQSGKGYSALLSTLEKFSNAVKTISENVITTLNNYEKTGNWNYTKSYQGIQVSGADADSGSSSSLLGWIADKVSQAADFIRDIDKKL